MLRPPGTTWYRWIASVINLSKHLCCQWNENWSSCAEYRSRVGRCRNNELIPYTVTKTKDENFWFARSETSGSAKLVSFIAACRQTIMLQKYHDNWIYCLRTKKCFFFSQRRSRTLHSTSFFSHCWFQCTN